MKRENIGTNEYFHVYNRGVLKQNIFFNDRDKFRFLFLILFLQYDDQLKNIDRMFKDFINNSSDYVNSQFKITGDRQVELISFCFMPNHFHICLRQIKDGGLSKYMQRLQNAYTKYINTKNDRSGHLFQGPYKAVLIENNTQLLHLSAYIHKNPKEIGFSNKNLSDYFWSSYSDYVVENRWGDFLARNVIIEQFNSKIKKDNYKYFVETSLTKEGEIGEFR